VFGCTSTHDRGDRPFKQIDTLTTARVEVMGTGLAERIRYITRIEPEAESSLTVVGQRASGEDGDDALLDIAIRVVDFPGIGPVSQGFSMHAIVPYGPGGVASPGSPLEQATEVGLRPARSVLARRVEAFARLIVIDILEEDGRTGSVVLTFPLTVAESLARRPAHSLLEALGGEDPEELFLAAAATDTDVRDVAIGQLIEGLSYGAPQIREATFGSLLYLTGETHGRSEYRWKDWWRLRRSHNAAEDEQPAP
jgi:hypothetical protein